MCACASSCGTAIARGNFQGIDRLCCMNRLYVIQEHRSQAVSLQSFEVLSIQSYGVYRYFD